jgi:hypothetical protein
MSKVATDFLNVTFAAAPDNTSSWSGRRAAAGGFSRCGVSETLRCTPRPVAKLAPAQGRNVPVRPERADGTTGAVLARGDDLERHDRDGDEPRGGEVDQRVARIWGAGE